MDLMRRPDNTAEVVEKVLRRAEVAKVARNLQNQLALATFKAQNGWQNLALSAIETEVGDKLKRKRTNSIGAMTADSMSSISDIYERRNIHSSPLTAPVFSDDVQGPDGTYKRLTHKNTAVRSSPILSHKRIQSNPVAIRKSHRPSRKSWKRSNIMSASSPPVIDHRPALRISQCKTLEESEHDGGMSPFDSPSDDDLNPLHSYQMFPSSPPRGSPSKSPPRTPSPKRSRSSRAQRANGREGADLLLYLASSPSPAQRVRTPVHGRVSTVPTTPPSNTLPSSMMTTPGGGGLFGLNTPGQNFNFADFVNVTPSPAQPTWGGRTPAPAKTPLAAKEARRRLNFDNPAVTASGSPKPKASGLALQLGEELGPRE